MNHGPLARYVTAQTRMNTADIQDRLADFIAAQLGIAAVAITDLHRLAGGASREIWSLELAYRDGDETISRRLVLRRDPHAAGAGTAGGQEFRLLRAAYASGVPVPRVYWYSDDPEVLGTPFFLMDRIDGETIPRKLLRDPALAAARAGMAAQFGRILAAIHGIDRVAHGLDFLTAPSDGQSPAQSELDRFEQIYRGITLDPHPAFELAFRWLRSHMPGGAECVVVHGDYRMGNVICGPEGIRAVLDWELAHVGDPMEDLGWLCVRSWRFGNDDRPVGGVGARDELFDAYAGSSGRAVDPERVRYWEILGNLKWGIITIIQARTYLDGHHRSVEHASIGRRTAETEMELLELIGS